jgi:hypothetical protein
MRPSVAAVTFGSTLKRPDDLFKRRVIAHGDRPSGHRELRRIGHVLARMTDVW